MFTIRLKSRFLPAMLCAGVLALPITASAQDVAIDEGGADLLPAQSVLVDPIEIDQKDATHAPIYITPDETKLLRVEGEIGTIIIGNPDHVNVLSENANTLVLISRLPGASSFQVLNKQGKVIMQRHVIVGSAEKEKYVRIRRSCNANLAGKATGDKESCKEMSLYYCPDMCHDIRVKTEERVREEEQAQIEAETAAAAAAAEKRASGGDSGGSAE